MTKQKKNSEKPSKDLKSTGQTQKTYPKELHLNLVHLLFLHGISAQLFQADKKKMAPQWRSFVHDMCLIMETYIDNIDDDKLKEKMNYKPIPEDDDSEDDKIN